MTACSRCGGVVEEEWARFQLDVMGTDNAACAECWATVDMDLQGEILGEDPDLQAELDAVYDLWVDSPEREEEWRRMTFPDKLALRKRVLDAVRDHMEGDR